ncbi:LysR family transcriptional regulator [Roseibium sp. RKSG952]|uniref:LysR family transcriptional regulator n=1 Tax=Roseibium sp. RKSG952 TaxID=2529384 RepID=UPI0012BC66D9|nr:LysR family transcriptional regulator [Roseibium sp. RKSG952]MTH97237.1 LysR family transcriptional regulator [Roseibium sp. RKSG952]
MDRRDLADLAVFQVVAEEGSFTRAAHRLGRAQSGLSQTVRALEDRLGVPLLFRTTRSVRLTDAGRRLFETLAPAFRQIEEGVTETRQARDRVAGSLRLTVMEYPARALVVPALARFLQSYPGVTVDLDITDRLTDIVANGFDAGIRFGTHLEQDMVAVPLGPDVRSMVVAAPDYFARHGKPVRLQDLDAHNCLSYRLASYGDIYRWRFQDRGRPVDVAVKGGVIVNDAPVLVEAALAGLGLAYIFEPIVADQLASGRLETCLEDFCPLWAGYHLYYPSRHQKTPALAAFAGFLREQASEQFGHGVRFSG